LGRQGAAFRQEFGILAGIDVVGYRGDLPAPAHPFAQPVHQCSLTRADRTAYPDAQRILRHLFRHERNSLEYWVSCAIEARSTAIVTAPKQAGSSVIP